LSAFDPERVAHDSSDRRQAEQPAETSVSTITCWIDEPQQQRMASSVTGPLTDSRRLPG
jgi:hypothetical protein